MVTTEFNKKVLAAMVAGRSNYGGKHGASYARSLGVDPTVYSTLSKHGYKEGLLTAEKWMELGKRFGVTNEKTGWVAVETSVFKRIKEEIMLCKQFGISRIFVDDCGIGKTFTARYLARTQHNVFYVDCTQCKKQNAFIKTLARVVGVELKGTLDEIKENTKYRLSVLENPVVIIDEAGALNKDALGLAQEYWNATGDDNLCGWYLMGANALRSKIEQGVSHNRDYFSELFSRYSDRFSDIVPKDDNTKKINFYRKLIRDVMSANIKDKSQLDILVNQCIVEDKQGKITGLRRAKSLILLNNA